MSYLYDELSWPEVRDTPKDRVVVLPVGTLEDHGHHLPINTDVVIVESICRRAVESMPEEALLLPAIALGRLRCSWLGLRASGQRECQCHCR